MRQAEVLFVKRFSAAFLGLHFRDGLDISERTERFATCLGTMFGMAKGKYREVVDIQNVKDM